LSVKKLGLGQGDDPQNPLLDQLGRPAMSRMMAQMEAYAQLDSLLAAGMHHIQSLGHVHGHGFFNQYVLAGLSGHFCVRGMKGIRGGDKDRLDVRVFQEIG